jgi:hypothetical protein
MPGTPGRAGDAGVRAARTPRGPGVRTPAKPLARLAENAVDASFLDERPKARLRTEITEMTLPDTGNFA